ncbi:leader peptidase (prepilin peptidase)/N-methyltransferase [Hoeflea marina]|uniref:Leader peptidase (Prepilin peptidase)/N-methyltransferase n=1 Tax=Hoeflea marina TaxID=274592 RepID=A0A317PLY3_9HYPH|nr:A24 family peptidase [Hoeflea marina]PWW01523.1 leader peptidase (prepilin peptidase)/N-methyltransferase [Hoeflea marina]
MTLAFFGVLVALCLRIAVVDLRDLRIPDRLNLALGLLALCHLAAAGRGAEQGLGRLAFAVAIALAFAGFRWLHHSRSGRIGLGLGDVKMIAMAALWIGPLHFPLFLFVASAGGLVFVLANSAIAGMMSRETRTPFGPFLAFGLVTVWPIQENLW